MAEIKDISGISLFRVIEKTDSKTGRIMWMICWEAYLVKEPVATAIENGTILILELHDATGNWRISKML